MITVMTIKGHDDLRLSKITSMAILKLGLNKNREKYIASNVRQYIHRVSSGMNTTLMYESVMFYFPKRLRFLIVPPWTIPPGIYYAKYILFIFERRFDLDMIQLYLFFNYNEAK